MEAGTGHARMYRIVTLDDLTIQTGSRDNLSGKILSAELMEFSP